MIEASTGTGKTRLLREAGLEGQLAGALVLSARGVGEGAAPYDVLRQLIRELFRKSPAETSFRFGAHASVIARVVPEVGLPQGMAASTSDPAEERLRQQQKLAQCDEVLANDFFLVGCREEFNENARLFIFETYCRIHQCIDINQLASKLNMDRDSAERWIVNLIRSTKLNAKIDSEAGTVVMGSEAPSIHELVVEKTKAITGKTYALTHAVLSNTQGAIV